MSLNLYAYEPLMPGKATEKASDEYGQYRQVDTGVFAMQTMVPTLLLLALNAMMIKRNINLKSTL